MTLDQMVEHPGELFAAPNHLEMLGPLLEQQGISQGAYAAARAAHTKARRRGARGRRLEDVTDAVTVRLVRAGCVVYPHYLDRTEDGSTSSQKERWQSIVPLIAHLHDRQVMVLPHSLHLFPLYPARSIPKKEELVLARRWQSQKEGERMHVGDAVRRALLEERLEDTYVGYDFEGTRSRIYRVVPVVDTIRAAILDAMLPEDAAEVTLYADTNHVFERGVEAQVSNIPSLSGTEKGYDVVLHHIPVVRAPTGRMPGNIPDEVKRRSYDFDSEHVCRRGGFFKVKYGRRHPRQAEMRFGDEILLDVHDILAFKRAKRALEQRGAGRGRGNMSYRVAVIDPFIEPGEEMIGFFQRLKNHVILESLVEAGSSFRIERRPLGESNPYLEIAMHKYIAWRNEQRKAA